MRLVSLCPSLTELVFDLGAGEALVGRTKFCIHPADGVAALEKLGGTKNPRVSRIVELAPDLVLMNMEENRREDAVALRAAGIAVHASMPRTVGDTANMVRDIAAAIGREATGAAIAHDIEQRAARVTAAARGAPAVAYAYLIWRAPWMTINGDTFIDAMLSLPGGRNVFADRAARYPEVTIDELRAASPDVVCLASEPFPFTERHVAELASLTGWDAERFVLVDGELLSWHGSRTPAGIDYAEGVISSARRPSRMTPSVRRSE